MFTVCILPPMSQGAMNVSVKQPDTYQPILQRCMSGIKLARRADPIRRATCQDSGTGDNGLRVAMTDKTGVWGHTAK